MMDEKDLEELTHRYWDENWSVEKYIQRLLPKELDCLRLREKPVEPAEILAQTVGFSWDPLLISLCSYKPETVVLILNEWYGKQEGAARGDKYKELVNKLKDNNLITKEPELAPIPMETVKDKPKPVDVFKFLEKHILPLLNEGKRVVVDITGAKKSMVSGAYLFAAYTNTPVSYVDFDKFNEDYGKPYGYTCEISELENPMELFKLREWDRVRQLYKRYEFWSAKELIQDIKEGVRDFLEDEMLKSINSLWEWLNFYGLWDDGDYSGCWNFKEMIKIKSNENCPTAVKELSKIWPNKKDLKNGINFLKSLTKIENSIYVKDKYTLIYAHDELAKIKRLVKFGEDYRSALLRAAGLSEFLFKARLIRSWVNNNLGIEINGYPYKNRESLKNEDEFLLRKVDKTFGTLGAGETFDLLQSYKSSPSKMSSPSKRFEVGAVKIYGLDNTPLLNNFWKGLKSGGLFLPDDIFTLRNDETHFCLSVPKEIAEIAVNFAEENLKDFENNCIKKAFTNGKFEAMGWEELCDLCGIDFLPKMRLDKDE